MTAVNYAIIIIILFLTIISISKNDNIMNYFILFCIGIIAFIVIKSFLNTIDEFKLAKDPKLDEIKIKIEPLFDKRIKYTGNLKELNNRDLLNEISLYKGEKSYTINKHKIFVCLRDEKGEYYPDNMLIYVILHELSHCICPNVGHTPEFNAIFDEVLALATKMRIYDPTQPIIMDYCLWKDA